MDVPAKNRFFNLDVQKVFRHKNEKAQINPCHFLNHDLSSARLMGSHLVSDRSSLPLSEKDADCSQNTRLHVSRPALMMVFTFS